MDQIRIGKFIAVMRKEKNLTQRQLAETIGISDKTVSKWETGNGMPDVSLMMPLCDALNITVNELLSGERLDDTQYKKKAEENIMELMKEKKESKIKIALSIICFVVTVAPSIALIMVASYFDLETWLRGVLIAIAAVAIIGGLAVIGLLDWSAGTYECPHCGKRFVPTFKQYFLGPHTLTKRSLKCPHCGKRSYCNRRLTH